MLRTRKYQDADMIVTLLTRDLGRIEVRARGMRQYKSRKRGHVDLFNTIVAQIVETKTWPLLIEAQCIDSLALESDSYRLQQSLSTAYHWAEILYWLLPEAEPHTQVYDWLKTAMREASRRPEMSSQISQGFKLRLLQYLGFWSESGEVPVNLDGYIESVIERRLYTSFEVSK